MKVRVWIGPAGSGKTARCLSALREAERAGQRAFLIVPDQFTYAADRLLLDDGSLGGVRFVRVVSFRRLTHLIALTGPASAGGPVASPQSQRLVLRGLVDAMPAEKLGPLAVVRHAPGFIDALANVIRELKAALGPNAAQELRAAAGDQPKPIAFAHLLQDYDQSIARAGLRDPGEWQHEIARELVRAPGPWAGRRFLIDGFMSFTADERSLLRALAQAGGELTVTLCGDQDDARLCLDEAARASRCGISPLSSAFMAALRPRLERPQFLPSLRTLLWLAESSPGTVRLEPLTGRPIRFKRASLLDRLERNLFREPPDAVAESTPDDPSTLAFLRLPSPYHEVRHWARLINLWTRYSETPIRYRDVAVMVRDLDVYRPIVRDVFAEHAIPLFIDQRRDVTAHPVVRLLLAALHLAAQGWTRPAVLTVLRNPLLKLSPDAVDRLENLSLEYGIEYERWHDTRWDVLPVPARGGWNSSDEAEPGDESADFATEDASPELADELADELAEELEDEPAAEPAEEAAPQSVTQIGRAAGKASGRMRAKLERNRLAAQTARWIGQAVFPSLRGFTDVWRSREPVFSEAADAIRSLLAKYPPGEFDGWSPAETARAQAIIDDLLDSGARLMGAVPISAGLMTRMIRDALSHASIGIVPQTLDAVTVAEIRRSRIDERSRIIFGGLDADAFPRAHTEDPFFSDDERERLAARGLRLSGSAAAAAEEEPFLFYVGCTRARDGLVITCPATGAKGAEQDPSSFLREIEKSMGRPLAPLEDRSARSPIADCHHPGEATAALAHLMRDLPSPDVDRLVTAAREAIPEAGESMTRAEVMAEKLTRAGLERLPAEIVQAMYPRCELPTSASRLELFARCPFQHFARCVLLLDPRPKAILSPLSTGSATHAALERFFRTARPPRNSYQAEREITRVFRELANEEEFRIFQIDPPSAYRWERTGRVLRWFVRAEWRRVRASAYQPKALELSFGLPAEHDDSEVLTRDTRERLRHEGLLDRVVLPAFEVRIARPDSDGTEGRVRLRGRIDRLDVYLEGDALRALVIDYKQKIRRENLREGLKNGVRIQTAAYLLAVRELLALEPAGALYYAVRPQPIAPGKTKPAENPLAFSLRGFFLKNESRNIDPGGAFLPTPSAGCGLENAADLDAVLEETRERIRAISADILGGTIGCRPLGERQGLPCRYCEVRDVCRFDPLKHPRRQWESLS